MIALVLSAQILLLMERDRPLAKRLRDLSTGGDALSILFAAFLTLGTLGALLGSLLHAPAPGAATGLTLALLTWITAGFAGVQIEYVEEGSVLVDRVAQVAELAVGGRVRGADELPEPVVGVVADQEYGLAHPSTDARHSSAR
ncbi:hypothetical protein AB0L64_37780 [Kribbella sp. NPDC051936]|uniref:hypothetical protein n=1 Tax=Kribbella sp. NPDC051936 TaxID=3154946 RepID=UPI00341B8416